MRMPAAIAPMFARFPMFMRTLPSPSRTTTRFSGCETASPSPIDEARPIEPIMKITVRPRGGMPLTLSPR